jgi:hypothetical protein
MKVVGESMARLAAALLHMLTAPAAETVTDAADDSVMLLKNALLVVVGGSWVAIFEDSRS